MAEAAGLLDWLTLHRALAGASVRSLRLLEEAGGDIQLAVQRGCAAQLGSVGLAAAREAALRDLEECRRLGVEILTIADPRYPPLLRRINGAPLLLFARGLPEALLLPQLAIVGSRNASAGGVANARNFASAMAQRGFAIASGLASGIDAAAHLGALDGGGYTVAALGTGPERVYPRHHAELAERIQARGALVSEFPPHTAVRRENFPRRNRIISGLALGTLVVEASLRSGSLITARLAGEQGREVFAIPGSIHNPLARGCHQLIREGAKLVETAQEICDELSSLVQEWRDSLPDRSAESTPAGQPAKVGMGKVPDPDYQRLREALGHDPVALDELARRAALTIPVLSSMLLRMELEGEVVSNPGGTYSRIASGA